MGHLPTPTDLYIHFAGDERLAMQPFVPQRFDLPAAQGPAAPECGTALAWTAAFTQVPVGDGDVVWTSGLARSPDFATGAPSLTWFIETVVPGSADPLPAPLQPMRLHAELRTGDAPGEDGRLLAQATTQEAPSAIDVEGRSVHKYTLFLSWVNRTVTAQEGMHLDIRLDAGDENCRISPPGVRAYADAQRLPAVRVGVSDPVRIDLLEPRLADDAWTIVWHASSPWGRFDLAEPQPPTVLGPRGATPTPTLVSTGDGPSLETVWSWDAAGAPNGTYRIDVALENRAGSALATASSLFQVGSDTPPAPAPQDGPAGKDSPGPGPLGALLVLVAGAAVLLRRR